MKNFHYVILFCLAFTAFFPACNKDPMQELSEALENANCDTCSINNILDPLKDRIDDTLRSSFNIDFEGLKPYDLPGIQPPSEGPEETKRDGIYICTSKLVKLGAEYNEQIFSSGRSDVFYPGNLLDGNTILTGGNRPISCVKAPLTYSISSPVSSGQGAAVTVENPDLATVRSAISELQKRIPENGTPAEITFDILESRSEKELDLHLGGSFSGWGAKLKASYDFNSQKVNTRFVIRFIQRYYSIDMNTVNKPSEYFAELPDINDFQGASPVIISSVSYGRMVFFSFESQFESEETKRAIDVSFQKWGMGGNVELSDRQKAIMNESRMSAVVLGGNADDGAAVISGIEGLKSYITGSAQFSPTSPGVPISYTMRFLKDNGIAKVVQNTEFTVRNCERYTEELSFHPQNGEEYYYCAQKTKGDGEFGGNGPLVDGKITLTNEENKIFAVLDCTWKEKSGNLSEGAVKETIHLYTIPDDKVFAGFKGGDEVFFSYTDTNHGPDYPAPSGADFINWLQLIGDTGGEDLGCKGDVDANIRFKFKPITVLVRLQEPK